MRKLSPNAIAAQSVINTVGSQVELARRILKRLRKKITPDDLLRMQWRIQKWTKTGVPINFVVHCEAITDIPREAIRPDYFGDSR